MNNKGFSPLEMLIAFMIITLFIGVLAYKYNSISLEGNISVAKTEIRTLRTMVKYFKYKYGRVPKSLKELYDKKMLSLNAQDVVKRNYFKDSKLSDPFGNYYIYDNKTGQIKFSRETSRIIEENQ